MPRRPTAHATAAVTPRVLTYAGYTGRRPARVYRPQRAAALPAIVIFFHGGDFGTGSIAAAAPIASELAQTLNAVVMTPAYTLACERPFPAAAEDAYAAVVWARVNAAHGGWNPDRIAVIGEEAGGNLAAAAALMARDRGGPTLAAQVLVSPMLDPTLSSGSMREAEIAGGAHSIGCCMAAYRRYLPKVTDHLHPYAAPTHCSRLAGVVPALIITTACDPLRDEAELYGAALAAAGVTAEVACVACVNGKACGWTAEVRTAIRAFLAPRLDCNKISANHR